MGMGNWPVLGPGGGMNPGSCCGGAPAWFPNGTGISPAGMCWSPAAVAVAKEVGVGTCVGGGGAWGRRGDRCMLRGERERTSWLERRGWWLKLWRGSGL